MYKGIYGEICFWILAFVVSGIILAWASVSPWTLLIVIALWLL